MVKVRKTMVSLLVTLLALCATPLAYAGHGEHHLGDGHMHVRGALGRVGRVTLRVITAPARFAVGGVRTAGEATGGCGPLGCQLQ